MKGMLTTFIGPLCLIISSCQAVPSQVQPPLTQAAAVAGISVIGTWQVVSVDGIVPSKSVNVTFRSDGAFAAVIDCNNARGYYDLSGAALSFRGWYSTERGCDPPLPHLDLITKALQGDGYVISFANGSELILAGPHRLILRRI